MVLSEVAFPTDTSLAPVCALDMVGSRRANGLRPPSISSGGLTNVAMAFARFRDTLLLPAILVSNHIRRVSAFGWLLTLISWYRMASLISSNQAVV
jgi:hypothetical protein